MAKLSFPAGWRHDIIANKQIPGLCERGPSFRQRRQKAQRRDVHFPDVDGGGVFAPRPTRIQHKQMYIHIQCDCGQSSRGAYVGETHTCALPKLNRVQAPSWQPRTRYQTASLGWRSKQSRGRCGRDRAGRLVGGVRPGSAATNCGRLLQRLLQRLLRLLQRELQKRAKHS